MRRNIIRAAPVKKIISFQGAIDRRFSALAVRKSLAKFIDASDCCPQARRRQISGDLAELFEAGSRYIHSLNNDVMLEEKYLRDSDFRCALRDNPTAWGPSPEDLAAANSPRPRSQGFFVISLAPSRGESG